MRIRTVRASKSSRGQKQSTPGYGKRLSGNPSAERSYGLAGVSNCPLAGSPSSGTSARGNFLKGHALHESLRKLPASANQRPVEAIHGANGESLRRELRDTQKPAPQLVFVIATHPDVPGQPILESTAQGVCYPGILRIRRVSWVRDWVEAEGSVTDDVFGVRMKIREVGPGVGHPSAHRCFTKNAIFFR